MSFKMCLFPGRLKILHVFWVYDSTSNRCKLFNKNKYSFFRSLLSWRASRSLDRYQIFPARCSTWLRRRCDCFCRVYPSCCLCCSSQVSVLLIYHYWDQSRFIFVVRPMKSSAFLFQLIYNNSLIIKRDRIESIILIQLHSTILKCWLGLTPLFSLTRHLRFFWHRYSVLSVFLHHSNSRPIDRVTFCPNVTNNACHL